MKETLVCLFFLGFVCFQTIYGQIDSLPKDKSVIPSGVLIPSKDTIPNIKEPTTTFPTSTLTEPVVNISENALDEKVEFGSKDTMVFDNAENKMHLYGDAFVKYQGIELKAGYIVVDLDSNIAVAQTHIDSIGQTTGKPAFTDGSQNFQANKMRYNFKSQKGLVFGVSTTQSNLFLTGTKTKFISKEIRIKDSIATENILYNRKAIFSTCDLPHPHYGIRSSKQKVIADKVVVAGPSNLEISGIPLPIVLPFAVFPLKQFKSTGLIFPQGYEYSPQWGFGLDGVGWYFPINDYIDLRATAQIYWHGTWGVTADSRYKKRYKYNGNFNLSYSSRKSIGDPNRTTSYAIRWNHNQDSKAHPTRQLSGNVNIQGNGYQRINNNDAQSVLQNTLSSNVSYSQRFPDKPFRLSANMSHSQNTLTNKVNLSLPTLNFQMDRIYPFKQKGSSSSKEKWFEKVSVRYNAQAQNKFVATDTTLFSKQTLEDARFGFKHDISTDLNFNLLKYINVSPNASLEEVWNFHTIRQKFDPRGVPDTMTVDGMLDTFGFGGAILENTVFRPELFRELTTGISLNTILYGTIQFKKGQLKGIRHTLKPNVSFNYIPAYTNTNGFFRNGIDTVAIDSDFQDDFPNPSTYNIFQGGVYGTPRSGKRQMLMNYSLNNIFEAKYYSKKDSIDKKLKIFDNIRIGGNYNFAADSLKFSRVSASGTTRLFKGMTTVNISASWDPYAVNSNNQQIKTSYFRQKRREDSKFRPLRFLQSNFRFNTRMSISTLKKLFKKESSTNSRPSQEGNRNRSNGQNEPPQPQDGFLKFLEGFNLNHSLIFDATKDTNQQTNWKIRTHSINITVQQIKLTENWGVGIGNIGYDFRKKKTVYPDLRITRDLHCWEAFFSWQPERGTYYFTIKVKNAPLDALKIPYSKNNVDAFGGF